MSTICGPVLHHAVATSLTAVAPQRKPLFRTKQAIRGALSHTWPLACLALLTLATLAVYLHMHTPAHHHPSRQAIELHAASAGSQASSTMQPSSSSQSWASAVGQLGLGPVRSKLVVYSYLHRAEASEELANLEVFIQQGVGGDDSADYLLLLPDDPDLRRQVKLLMPALPSYAHYVWHAQPASCGGWGMLGWLLGSGLQLRTSQRLDTYPYYLLVDSSARGPFLPHHIQGLRWSDAFIRRLGPDVKLAGSTISCEGAAYGGDSSGHWRQTPHVQSFALALDSQALRLLLEDRRVLQCYDNRWEAIWHSQLGSALAVFQAGYTIDSLMARYQGVDWRNSSYHGCNQRRNPSAPLGNDGLDLSPMEVMFVVVREQQVTADLKSEVPLALSKYKAWQDNYSKDPAFIIGHELQGSPAWHHAEDVLLARDLGMGCFDTQFYLDNNQDLQAAGFNPVLAWRHFVQMGQFEGRKYRYSCDPFQMLPGTRSSLRAASEVQLPGVTSF